VPSLREVDELVLKGAGTRKGLRVTVRVVRLGADRFPGEGLRIGTVRRPPRGVPKSDYSSRNFYDVWLPALAPSAETVKLAQKAQTRGDWLRFMKKYRAEMARPENRATLDLLAALSHHADFSVGCYCADESRCHRSVLRALLQERGALVV
jgi:uncharacterized protein YeaO (DUF488 family)